MVQREISMAAPWRHKLLAAAVSCLEFIWTCCLLQLIIGVASDQNHVFEGFLLCRKCGYEIAKTEDIVSLPTVMALRQRNDTIPHNKKVLIQLFKNPHGIYFEVITSSEAEVEVGSEKFAADSWFPGFAWSLAKCPRCGAHVGWSFAAVSDAAKMISSQIKNFVGLIMDKVMHEDEVNNLIAMPKTYAS